MGKNILNTLRLFYDINILKKLKRILNNNLANWKVDWQLTEVAHVIYKPAPWSHVILLVVFKISFNLETRKIMGYTLKLSLLCLLVTIASAVGDDLVIKNADRTVDITSQLVRVTHRLTLSNNGKCKLDVDNFFIILKLGTDIGRSVEATKTLFNAKMVHKAPFFTYL